MSGCFIQSLAMPQVGESTEIAIDLAEDRTVSVAGEVVYVETGMGFAVRFINLEPEATEALQRLVDSASAAS